MSLLQHIIEHDGEKKWCKLVHILQGRTENAIKNRFQLLFSKMRRKKENKSKDAVELITEYVLEKGGAIPIKKQREAEKSESSHRSTPRSKPRDKPTPPEPQPEPLPSRSRLPVIPRPLVFSSREMPSAFVPYEGGSSTFTTRMFIELPGRQVVSMGELQGLASDERLP